MNFAEGLRGLGFSDADISFLHRDYAFESMCKDMKIKPYMRNKSETKIILLYLFKSRLSKNRKNQKSLIRLILSTLFVTSFLILSNQFWRTKIFLTSWSPFCILK